MKFFHPTGNKASSNLRSEMFVYRGSFYGKMDFFGVTDGSSTVGFVARIGESDSIEKLRESRAMFASRSNRQGQMILGAFAALFDDTGRILCAQRGYGARTWTTPGGMVESGESPVDAVCREVLEETGWVVRVEHLIGVYSVPTKNDHAFFFHVTPLERKLWSPNDEITAVEFFPADALPTPMSQRATARIRDAFAGYRGMARTFDTMD